MTPVHVGCLFCCEYFEYFQDSLAGLEYNLFKKFTLVSLSAKYLNHITDIQIKFLVSLDTVHCSHESWAMIPSSLNLLSTYFFPTLRDDAKY